MEKVKLIGSIEQIKEYEVRYAHFNSPSKWIKIDLEPEGTFSVFGYVSGDNPTSITTGQYVKEWKTFKGVLNYLKKCSENGSWGMSKFKTSNTINRYCKKHGCVDLDNSGHCIYCCKVLDDE